MTERRSDVRLKQLLQLNALLLERDSAAGLARAIVEEGRVAIGACAAAVAVPEADGLPRILAAHGYPDEQLSTDAAVYRGRTPIVDVLRGSDTIWIESRAELERQYPELAGFAPDDRASWAALPLDANARRVGVLALSFQDAGPFTGDHREFMLMVAQQCAQAMERARLGELAMKARVHAEFAERRLTFLADVSARLAGSLDYRVTLASVADAAVPEMADWCLIHLVDEDRRLRLVAAQHADPDMVKRVRDLAERYPISERAGAGAARVMATGEPQFLPALTQAHLRDAAQDEAHYNALRALQLRSQLSVPIPANGETCGVLTLANAESGRVLSESDLTFAVELGLRAGQAVQNARLYQAAYNASIAKSDFLAVMSHELRTPLNAIIGYSDLLLLGVPEDLPEAARRQVERIRSASTSLLYLVDEVLSFSRIEAGKEDIRISPVDLIEVARETVTMIEPLAAEKGLSVELDALDAQLKVVSDQRKVKQILTNLLSNAVKFTAAGGIVVRVRRTPAEVQIDVVDTGIGIQAEHLDQIFEPFWQVEQSATRRFGGTGLGLGVARKLARLIEGRLDVRSTPGQGSTFTLALPLHTPGVAQST